MFIFLTNILKNTEKLPKYKTEIVFSTRDLPQN